MAHQLSLARSQSAPTDVASPITHEEVPADSYLSLRTLSSYAGLSVRWLRGSLSDPASPLPHYRVGGKILIRRSEFDAWMAQFRHPDSRDQPHADEGAPTSRPGRVTRPPRPRLSAGLRLEQLSDRQLDQLYQRMFPTEPPTES
jgi:excisionase family DNA binding protein